MENNELITEETTPTEEATVQEAQSEIDSAGAGEKETEAESNTDTATEEEVKISSQELFKIRYMHEDVDISMDEAKRLAQIGKHYEDNVKKTLDSLDYVATLQGKSVKELVENLVNGVDSAKREELISELGADNPLVDELMELHKAKNDKAYESAKAERSTREKHAEEEAQKSATTKLAEQFEELRELFPEYDTVEKVPDTVIKRALKSGDLEKEMLRYRFAEAKKVEAEKASQEKNKKESIGSVHSEGNETERTNAFLKGLWS